MRAEIQEMTIRTQHSLCVITDKRREIEGTRGQLEFGLEELNVSLGQALFHPEHEDDTCPFLVTGSVLGLDPGVWIGFLPHHHRTIKSKV